jgi:hypothetical protein
LSELLISAFTLKYLEQNDPAIMPEINAAFGSLEVLASAPAPGQALYLTDANAPGPKTGSVMYDPEHWLETPLSQQAHTVKFIKQLASEVHAAGGTLNIAPAPDLETNVSFDPSTWPSMLMQNVILPAAPYVDAVTLQFQRYEANPVTFDALVDTAVAELHAVNPHLQIFVDMSSNPAWHVSNANLVAEFQHIAHETDGVWFTTPSGTGLAQAEYLFQHIDVVGIDGMAGMGNYV